MTDEELDGELARAYPDEVIDDRLSRVMAVASRQDCRTPGCAHTGACREADRRRAQAGHPVTLVPRPKMDAPGLVAAQCGCVRGYESSGSTPHGALRMWRQHADAKITAAAAESDHRPRRL